MKPLKEIAQELYDFALENDNSSEIMSYFYEKTQFFIESTNLTIEELDCTYGCSSCCHLPLMCPPQTIIFLREIFINTLPPDQLDNLKDTLKIYVDQWSQTPEKERLFTRIPCPFLDPEHTCSIYEIRPFSCRAFTSTDVRVCQHVYHNPTDINTSITQNSFIYAVYQLTTTILSSVAKTKNRDNAQVYFIPSLLFALENEDYEHNWKAGKKLPYS